MTFKATKLRKRVIVTLAILATACLLIFILGLAIPLQYRIGVWHRLPTLDHRLLPYLSALFAAIFGAFFGSLSAFCLGRLQQRSDRREKRHAALIATQYALIS
jgi:membrane associated rhomboid family serine protease